MSRKLSVYLHQVYVGELLQDDSGQMLFTYAKDWLNNPKNINQTKSFRATLNFWQKK